VAVGDKHVDSIVVNGGGIDGAPAISAAVLSAIALRKNRIIVPKIPGTYNIGSTITAGTQDWRGEIDFCGNEVKALAGFAGTMIQIDGGEVKNATLTGSSLNTVGHRGINIGSVTQVNARVKLSDITYGGGLYDVVHSRFETDSSEINGLYAFNEVGRSLAWLAPNSAYPPTAGAKFSHIHANNPINSPPSGASKKYGLYLEGMEISGFEDVILNNYDFCVSIGDARGVWGTRFNGLHTEDRRTCINVPWAASSTVTVGMYRTPQRAQVNGRFYICLQGGVTGATQPTWPTGDNATVNDGTAIWQEVGASVGVRAGLASNVKLSGVWLNNHLASVLQNQQGRIVFDGGDIMGKHAAYISQAGNSVVGFRDSDLNGEVILAGGSAMSAVRTSVINNASSTLPSLPSSEWSNVGDPSPPKAARGVTSNTTMTLDDNIIYVDATAGPVTITGIDFGFTKEVTIYRTDTVTANAVTVTAVYNFLEGGSSHTLAGRGSSLTMIQRPGATALKLNITA